MGSGTAIQQLCSHLATHPWQWEGCLLSPTFSKHEGIALHFTAQACEQCTRAQNMVVIRNCMQHTRRRSGRDAQTAAILTYPVPTTCRALLPHPGPLPNPGRHLATSCPTLPHPAPPCPIPPHRSPPHPTLPCADKGAKKRAAAEAAAEGSGNIAKMFRTAAATRPSAKPTPTPGASGSAAAAGSSKGGNSGHESSEALLLEILGGLGAAGGGTAAAAAAGAGAGIGAAGASGKAGDGAAPKLVPAGVNPFGR